MSSESQTITLSTTQLGRIRNVANGDAPASPPPPREAVVPRQLGPVSLTRELGRGGMGVVWLGEHQVLRRQVAVKFMLGAAADEKDPGFQAFLAGARAAAAVRHMGVTAVLHADVVEGVPYLVMEYVDGPTAADVLRATGPLAQGAGLGVMLQVAAAVAELHERSILHRDIKPSNVMLDAEGRAYLTDFGLACMREQVGTMLAGSPAYMAPEMFDGQVSPRSDVFAMGVTTYELLTGQSMSVTTTSAGQQRPAFDDMARARLRERQVRDAVIDVIERATHASALFRFKSARQLERALQDAAGQDARGAHTLIAALVAHARPVARDGGAPPDDTSKLRADQDPRRSSRDAYFQTIAGLAEKKRSSAPPSPPAPAAPPAPSAPAPSADGPNPIPAELIAEPRHEKPRDEPEETEDEPDEPHDDVRCVDCGYNLRGQPADGRCPECGHAVADSLLPHRLLMADRRWWMALVANLSLARLLLPLWPIAALPMMWPDVVRRTTPFAIACLCATAQLIVYLIVWPLAAPPRRAAFAAGGTSGRLVRAAMWFVAAASVAIPLARVQFDLDHPLGRIVESVTYPFSVVCLVGFAVVIMRYLRAIAMRLDDLTMRRTLTHDLIAVILCGIVALGLVTVYSMPRFIVAVFVFAPYPLLAWRLHQLRNATLRALQRDGNIISSLGKASR